MNQVNDASGSTSRCGSCFTCLVVSTILSIVVLVVAILMAIGLASRGGGYSIGAAIVVFLFLIFIILFPLVGGIIFILRTGISELKFVRVIIFFCLSIVFTLSPFIFILAFALTIAEVVEGDGNSEVRVLALFVATIELVAAAAGLFLCVMCCIYIRRHSPNQETKEEKQLAEDLAAKKTKARRGNDVI